MQRVADALDISERTVRNIKLQNTETGNVSSLKRYKQRTMPKTTDLDKPIQMEVRNSLYDMYSNSSDSSLNRLLHNIDFKFKKENNRRALQEKASIASMRCQFLRKYMENLQNGFSRYIVFLDETWIFSKGSAGKSWQNNFVKSVRKPEGFDGKRFIVLHAGTKNSFVQNANLIFASKSKTLDYHEEMNSDMFVKWIPEKLIPNLPEPSLIIMDNAPYHSTLVEKQPCSS